MKPSSNHLHFRTFGLLISPKGQISPVKCKALSAWYEVSAIEEKFWVRVLGIFLLSLRRSSASGSLLLHLEVHRPEGNCRSRQHDPENSYEHLARSMLHDRQVVHLVRMEIFVAVVLCSSGMNLTDACKDQLASHMNCHMNYQLKNWAPLQA